MKFYAVIDTNVVVSAALKKGSIPWRIVDEALSGDIIPLLCDEILAEYEDVLSRPKFEISDAVISSFLDDLKQRAVFVNPAVVEGAFPDQSDVVFYAVLMEKRKEAEARLVTGNLRHFPSRSFVVTPKEMLHIIRQARGEQDDDYI